MMNLSMIKVDRPVNDVKSIGYWVLLTKDFGKLRIDINVKLTQLNNKLVVESRGEC